MGHVCSALEKQEKKWGANHSQLVDGYNQVKKAFKNIHCHKCTNPQQCNRAHQWDFSDTDKYCKKPVCYDVGRGRRARPHHSAGQGQAAVP